RWSSALIPPPTCDDTACGPPTTASGASSSLTRVGEPTRASRALLATVTAVLALLGAACGQQASVPPITTASPVTPANAAGAQALPPPPPAALPLVPKLLAPLSAIGNRSGPRVCDKFGSVPVAGGRFEVQNDAWG